MNSISSLSIVPPWYFTLGRITRCTRVRLCLSPAGRFAYNQTASEFHIAGAGVDFSNSDDPVQRALSRIAAGEVNKGIAELDRLIGRQLERYFERNGAKPEDAEELVWTFFTRASHPTSGYRADAPAMHWINTCKRRLMIDYWRKRKLNVVQPDVDDDGEDRDPFENIPAVCVDESVVDCIERAFAAFRAAYPKRALHLVWIIEEWSNEEIAEALGVGLGAARDRKYETRKKLDPFVAPCKPEQD